MKQHLLALLIAALTIGITFLMLYSLLTGIHQGQIALCWPVYWLFIFLFGILYVCIHQGIQSVQLARKNGL